MIHTINELILLVIVVRQFQSRSKMHGQCDQIHPLYEYVIHGELMFVGKLGWRELLQLDEWFSLRAFGGEVSRGSPVRHVLV